MKRTLIIVPTYNERENLPTMAECLSKLPIPVDLLVVDDNSPDGTGKIEAGVFRFSGAGLGKLDCCFSTWPCAGINIPRSTRAANEI